MHYPKVTFVMNDEGDWVGLYIDGYLAYEGHSISETKMLELLDINYESFYNVKLDDRLPYTVEKLHALVSDQDDKGVVRA